MRVMVSVRPPLFRGRGSEELEQALDVGLVGAGDGVALVDETEKQELAELGAVSGALEWKQRDGRRAERDAVHSAEAARQCVKLRRRGLRCRQHVRVQQRRDSATRRVTCYQQRVRCPLRVLL